jgi:iron complex transport system substrate-binding protein
MGDIGAIAAALDLADEGDELTSGLRSRLARLRGQQPAGTTRVACIEWLDPPYLAGHWVPDLVAAAGGIDAAAVAGDHSARTSWPAVEALRPELILVMLCGFGIERALAELRRVAEPAALCVLRSAPVWVLDGNAYTSRPGPRIVDGAARIQAALRGVEHRDLIRWQPSGQMDLGSAEG